MTESGEQQAPDGGEHQQGDSALEPEFTIAGLAPKFKWNGDRLEVLISDENGDLVHGDRLDPLSDTQRSRFLKSLQKKAPAISDESLLALDKLILKQLRTRPSEEPEAHAHETTDGASASVEFSYLAPAAIKRLKSEAVSHVDAILSKATLDLLASSRETALQLGQANDLLYDIAAKIEHAGHVGETRNCALQFLVYLSCRLPKPLHSLVVGPSSGGKSHLCEKTSNALPPELVVTLTDMTPKFLAYLGMFDVACKAVVLGERTLGDEELVAVVNKFKREMQSNGYISHGTVQSDGKGKNSAQTRVVIGPISSSETTTKDALSVFPEDRNRCIIIESDLTENQTKAIARRKGQEAEGGDFDVPFDYWDDPHNLIRLLKRPSRINLPFASMVAEVLPCNFIEVRRLLPQVISLMQICAFLHQMRRPALGEDGETVAWGAREHGDHILVGDARDYEIVANLMNLSLKRTLRGTITEADRMLLRKIQGMIKERVDPSLGTFFYTTDVLRLMGLEGGDDASNLRKGLRRLCDVGAVNLVQQGTRGSANRYDLVKLEGVPQDTGWFLPPTYEKLCAEYHKQTGLPVPDHLSMQGVREEPWSDQLGDAERTWGVAPEEADGDPTDK